MQMTATDYLKDIGLTYLMIPTITIALGLVLETRAGPGTRPTGTPHCQTTGHGTSTGA